MPPPFDAQDAAILAALQGDARLTVAQLSDKIRLSTSPTWRRVKRLEEEGAISMLTPNSP